MARIDRFIDALVKRGADRVLLQSGEKASLVFGDDARPVTASALHNKPLRTFVKEIVPPELVYLWRTFEGALGPRKERSP